MRIDGNTILITGGTSGIGRALAERLHAAGNSVIIAGRRKARLDEICAANPGMVGYVADMTDAAGATAFAERVKVDHPALNVLIVNAGIMRIEDLRSSRDLTGAEEVITTNLLAPIRLVNDLVDHLKAQRDSVIVMVTSSLAFVPVAHTPTYCATKAALHSYTQSLRYQLRDMVEVSELPPPAVQTELMPGQDENAMFMPVGDFVDKVMVLLAATPTPEEILVEESKGLRFAERENRTASMLQAISAGFEAMTPAA